MMAGKDVILEIMMVLESKATSGPRLTVFIYLTFNICIIFLVDLFFFKILSCMQLFYL